MSIERHQTSATEPGILFERLSGNHCNSLILSSFLFEWKTSA